MAAKKGSMTSQLGGFLVLLGALVYLYVFFTWYGSGTGTLPAWVSAASFLGPFVVVAAVIAGVTLLFMGLGALAGMGGDSDMKMNILWKFIMVGAISELILTGWSGWFWTAIGGFVLTYIGGMMQMM